MAYGKWAPYVPVAKRRGQALKEMSKLAKTGKNVQPVHIAGREISKTFWGKAWCTQMEHCGDYENRLPRGRTYVRNGSVCHLEIGNAEINAYVSGSSLYTVSVKIAPLAKTKWEAVKTKCAGQIGSLIELLQGKLSRQVMDVVTHPVDGLLPRENEIKIRCSCPDGAYLCKHAAATLYGVGARLDTEPQLLFLLRGVDHQELVPTSVAIPQTTTHRSVKGDLANLFGIELEPETLPVNAHKKESSLGEKKKRMGKNTRPIKAARAVKASTKKTVDSIPPVPAKPFRASRASIKKLRKQLDMTPEQFASLLGVSAASVRLWEESAGPLQLRAKSQQALDSASRLSKAAAWTQVKI